MKLNVNYNVAELEAAARFIWNHNPYVPRWAPEVSNPGDIMVRIKDFMIGIATKLAIEANEAIKVGRRPLDDFKVISTGGYTVICKLYAPGEIDDEDDSFLANCTILVDPAVANRQRQYETESIDF